MPTLSLCMIVRDEAKLLPDFLQHVRGLFNQLVAVDTGSVDDTPDILRAAGAEVFSMQWQDDFSLARNESLRHAKSDWILVLDADEFPWAGFAEEVRALMAMPCVGAATITRHDEQSNGLVRVGHPLRLFRNHPSIAYSYRIHEEVSSTVMARLRTTGMKQAQIGTPVRHVGYLPEQMKSKSKLERDERLLLLAMAEDQNDFYSRFKLLEQYRFWGQKEKMVPVAHECLKLVEKGRAIEPAHNAGELVGMICSALYAKGSAEGMEFLLQMAPVADFTGHYHLVLAAQYELRDQQQLASQHFSRALELAENDPSELLIQTRALCGLARLSIAIGDIVSADEFANAAVAVSQSDPEVELIRQFLARRSDIPLI